MAIVVLLGFVQNRNDDGVWLCEVSPDCMCLLIIIGKGESCFRDTVKTPSKRKVGFYMVLQVAARC